MRLEYTPESSYIGFLRSGQHAVINWIFCHLPGSSLFINNYSVRHHSLFWYQDGHRLNGKYNMSPDYCGVGLEGDVNNPLFPNIPKIIVIRDIKNNAASVMKHRYMGINTFNILMEAWEKYAKYALGEIKIEKSYCVKFPLWHSNIEYREKVFYDIMSLLNLDLKFSDAGREEMMTSGNGSSFTGEEFRGRASEMDVNNRYRSINIPEIPTNLLSLDKEIFGDI